MNKYISCGSRAGLPLRRGVDMTYLTIITTALVLTQIIRVIQNSIQLKKYSKISDHNELILRVYTKIEEWLDREE